MAKRKPEDPPAGSPAWMATFSDLMNLLLCFFVLLFSMSSVDTSKLQDIVAGLQSSPSIFNGGAKAIGEGSLIGNGVSQLNQLDQYISSMGKTSDSETESDENNEYDSSGDTNEQSEYEQLKYTLEQRNLQANEQMAELIKEAVDESNMTDQIEISFDADYIQLSLKGALLFDSGKAQVKKAAEPVMNKVGIILEKYADGMIEIEGHTDNVPISNSDYPNNDELSSARALSVFYYLMDKTTLQPYNIKHSGRGEYHPIADNSTEPGRSKNRRVEIRIYHQAG